MTRQFAVSVDKSLCVSNGWCIKQLPGVFRADESGQSEVIAVTGATEEELIDAGFNCPVGAISVTDAATGEDLLA